MTAVNTRLKAEYEMTPDDKFRIVVYVIGDDGHKVECLDQNRQVVPVVLVDEVMDSEAECDAIAKQHMVDQIDRGKVVKRNSGYMHP